MGRPYAPPAMHSRGPMMPPPRFPGGQQRPGFGPPPAMPQPYGGNTLTPGQQIPAAPPVHMMSSQHAPGTMPSRHPPPPGLLPAAGQQVPSLGQSLPGPPPGASSTGAPRPGAKHPGAPPLNTSSAECSSLVNSPLPPSAPPQGSQGHLLPTVLPTPPQKPIDDEVVRNIEVLSQFVAKNGPQFENMARDKQAGNPKFSFLFGGEPGSDAAIGQDYFHWFKMKCQMEQSTSRKGEGRSLLAAPSFPFDSSQQPTGPGVVSGGLPAGSKVASAGLATDPKIASGGSSIFPAVSDMDMDMDMEDDVAVPILLSSDSKNIQTTVSMEGEFRSVENSQQTEERAVGCEEKTSVVASGSQMEASRSELQKEKEAAFEVPCVEDVSPARTLQELHQTLTTDRSDVKNIPTSEEDLPVIPSKMPESDAFPRNSEEVMLTGSVCKSARKSAAVDLASEVVILAENKSGLNFGHDDMECSKLEDVKPCNDGNSVKEGNHSNNKEYHVSLNNNISLEAVNMKPNITLEPNDVKSEKQVRLKQDNKGMKIDKYGRMIREGNSDSESDGGPHAARGRAGYSQSRSPSPSHNRWRKRSYSRSPRRKARWSGSRSRSPKRRRSRSRTPVHEFRRGVDARGERTNRGRGTPPVCNDFARGRCQRGASCRFLHWEPSGDSGSRWASSGRGRERIENRQDVAKSVKESFRSGELDKPRSISPDRFVDEHERDYYVERRNQESYGYNDRSATPCHDFSKGRCYRGSSCRYLHSETAPDSVGRWSSVRKSRERTESRQDISKPFCGMDDFGSVEVDKTRNFSPNRMHNQHYRHNFRERRSHDVDRRNDRSVPACIFFARGCCQKGLSCRFFHPDATGNNDSGRSRERPESRSNITEPFGGKGSSAALEMDKNKNNFQESNSYGHDRREPFKGHRQEMEKHNYSSANPAEKSQFLNPGREKLQSHREELWSKTLSTDAPSQTNQRENVGGHFMPRDLPSRSLSWEKFDADSSEGPSAPSETDKSQLHNPVEHIHQQPLRSHDLQYQTEILHSKNDLNSTPFQSLLGNLPVLPDHCATGPTLSSGQSRASDLGTGGGPLQPNDGWQGSSPSCSNVESSVVSLPSGFSTNSSIVNPPAEHSGIGGCSMPYHQNSIMPTLNSIPQPGYVHGSTVQGVNYCANDVPTHVATAIPEQRSICAQPPLELVNLQHASNTGQESLMPRLITMPLFPPQNQLGGQIGSMPLSLFGEQNVMACSQAGVPFTPSLSTVNQPSKDIPGFSVVNQLNKDIPGLSAVNQPNKDMHGLSTAKHNLGLPAFNLNQPSKDVPGLSAVDQPHLDMSAQENQYDPLYDGIDYSAGAQNSLKKDDNTAASQDVKTVLVEAEKTPLLQNVSAYNKDVTTKPSTPSRPQDIVGNNEHKNSAELSLKRSESQEAAHAVVQAGTARAVEQAGIAVVANGSPRQEGKSCSPGHLLEAAAANAGDIATEAATEHAGDIATDQAHGHDESKKNKEIRMMRAFRSELAEFVKEVLKPTWREGQMSKEAFKTIVKKVVDKVAGSLQSHQIPKSQEKIDQFLELSRPKLTKLVQGYVDKYVKA